MRTVFIVILSILCVSALCAQVIKTVGVADSTNNYPTIAAAFAAINAGSITDGNGNPADSVTIVLMDSVYNEAELSLSPTTGNPRVVIMDGDAINPTINITQVLGTGVGLRIDNLESFVHACVNISLDTAFTWATAMELYQAKEWVRPCPSHVMSIYAPTATTGIRVIADSGGTFTMENCTVVASRTGFFEIGLGNVTEFSSISLKHNTFIGTGADSSVGILVDSVTVSSVVIDSNTVSGFVTGMHHGLIQKFEGGDIEASIIRNVLTGMGTDSGVGIFLGGIRGGAVRIDSNEIDMGGSGVAIKETHYWNAYDATPQEESSVLKFRSNNISSSTTGILIDFNNDTTGLGGIPPDSLSFGSFEISDNTMSGVTYGIRRQGLDSSDFGHGQGDPNIIIRRNTMTGSTDPNNPALVGIDLDSLCADSIIVEDNIISAFKGGVRTSRCEEGYFPGESVCSISRNIIIGTGAETGVGISLEKKWCFAVKVEDNVVDMNGSGTAIKTGHLWNAYDGTCQESKYLSNIIFNATTGISVELNSDTTGLGSIPPDSLSFGSFEISDNTLNIVSRGIRVGGWDQVSNNPGQGHINKIAIKNNVLNGSLDPNMPALDGIRIDSLMVDTVVIESNTIQRFTRSVTNIASAHEKPENFPQQIMSFNDNTITGGTLSLQSVGFDSVRVTNNTLMSETSNILALRVSTARRQSVDENVPGAISSAVPDGSAPRHQEASVTAVDTLGTFVFSGNTVNGLVDGEIEATDVILHLESNTFHGAVSFLAGTKATSSRPGSVLTGNALRVSTARRQSVDSAPRRVGHGTIILENTVSLFSAGGLILSVFVENQPDTEKVLLDGNTFSNNGGDGLEIIVEGDSGLVVVNAVSNIFSDNGGNGVAYRGRGDKNSQFKDHRGQGHDNIIEPKAFPGNANRSMLAAVDPPNSFVNNTGIGLLIEGNVVVPDGLQYQNFSNNGSYNLFNGTTQPIDADSNWWGTSDSAVIASTIFDGEDSSGLGIVSFVPFLIGTITSADISLNAGWNLVSLPVGLFDYSTTAVFPNAISQAFAYNGSYSTEPVLSNSAGYWVKFGAAENSAMLGLTLDRDSIDVNEGWNLIGSISSAIAMNQITSVPGGIVTSQLFQYNNGYQTADSIRPGKGYWVKVSVAGKLVLATAPGAAPAAIHIVPTDELPPTAPESESQHSKAETPIRFTLSQNYPNPFNPSTVIDYQLPVSSYVTFKVYNILGQEVTSLLLEERMEPGSYEIKFNALSLTSGVYIYRITAIPITNSNNGSGIFSSIKKMVLLK